MITGSGSDPLGTVATSNGTGLEEGRAGRGQGWKRPGLEEARAGRGQGWKRPGLEELGGGDRGLDDAVAEEHRDQQPGQHHAHGLLFHRISLSRSARDGRPGWPCASRNRFTISGPATPASDHAVSSRPWMAPTW